MPPSDVARVMSASRNGLLMDDLVPRMHMMDDRTAANDSLHLSQLITTGYGFCCFRAGGLSQHLSIFVRFVSAVTLTCGILAAVRRFSAG